METSTTRETAAHLGVLSRWLQRMPRAPGGEEALNLKLSEILQTDSATKHPSTQPKAETSISHNPISTREHDSHKRNAATVTQQS